MILQSINSKKEKDRILDEFLSSRIIITTTKFIHFIDSNKVIYLRANSNYTEVKLMDGSRILSSKTLKFYEEYLSNKSFLRVHASYLINITKAIGIKRNGIFNIVLENDMEIPVSRKYRSELFNNIF